ncbi:MAG: hypothetical protein Q4G16_09030 [Cruoricaptor ignavus]|nr:hypothetical protein [Cruoricaptor ignavus]
MGYHIVNIKENEIEHKYFENQLDIIYFENLTENTIIYQGEKQWSPLRLGNAPKYKNYAKEWFRAGLKAQEIFKKQAKKEKLILEELFQDESSFQQYLINEKYLAIKRGDFLVRNYGNIEVDIKCRGFYEDKNGNKVFNFKCDDVIKHLNMQSLTNTPILIAVYERNGDKVIDGNPYFFSIENTDFSKFNKIYIKSEDTGYCYQIPLDCTTQTFEFIKNYNLKKKKYTVEEKRKENKNAYMRWSQEEDNQLEINYCKKKSIKELCSIFGRNEGAIKARIEKLELLKKYNN